MGFFYDNYRPKIEKLTGQNVSSWEKMLALCGYIEWSSYSSVELKFTPTDFDYKYCLAMGDAKLFSNSFGTDIIWRLSAVQFLEDIRGWVSKLNSTAEKLKFIHYAAHAET